LIQPLDTFADESWMHLFELTERPIFTVDTVHGVVIKSEREAFVDQTLILANWWQIGGARSTGKAT
jgi:hypothetical protein